TLLFLLLPLTIRTDRFKDCPEKTTMEIIECVNQKGEKIQDKPLPVYDGETCKEGEKEVKLYAAVSLDPITSTLWRLEQIFLDQQPSTRTFFKEDFIGALYQDINIFYIEKMKMSLEMGNPEIKQDGEFIITTCDLTFPMRESTEAIG
ncbi:hypothetical protein PENTCL1PPCAC_1074, partial [Pristionchus entomophagus]